MKLSLKVSFFIGLSTQAGDVMLEGNACHTVYQVLSRHGVDGFNVTPGTGYWKGVKESCIIVTVFTTEDCPLVDDVPQVAKTLAVRLDQESVLWQCEVVDAGISYSKA